MSLSGQLIAVWWAFPMAEVVSLLLCILFHRYIYKKELLPMMQEGGAH